MRSLPTLLALVGVVALAPRALPAQTILLQESFDNTGATGAAATIPNLQATGWTVEVHTSGSAPSGFYQAPTGSWPFTDPPKEGAGYLGVATSPGVNSNYSAWLILPPIGNLGGEDLSLFISATDLGMWRELEIRYSPSGQIGTGGTTQSVGDFTDLLAKPMFIFNSWSKVSASVPGNGRLAIRLISKGGGSGVNENLGLDDLIVSGNVGPPLPGPGETVHWTPAMSPVIVDATWSVVESGTLIIDAGVDVRFEAKGQLHVHGTLLAQGTAAQTIQLTRLSAQMPPFGWHILSANIPVGVPGPLPVPLVSLDWTESDVDLKAVQGGGLELLNCTLRQGGSVEARFASALIKGSHLQDTRVQIQESWARLIGSVFDNSPVTLRRVKCADPVMVQSCEFWDCTSQAALSNRYGNDLFLAADNVFRNNLLAVDLHGAGLFPGSVVPDQGNVINEVLLGDLGGPAHSPRTHLPARVGAPYRATATVVGNQVVEPGATFFMDSGSSFRPYGDLLGTPDQPIRFEPFGALLSWAGVQPLGSTLTKMESVEVVGAQTGFRYPTTIAHVSDCLFQDCATGVIALLNDGIIHIESSRFYGNQVAAEASLGTFNQNYINSGSIVADKASNPNAFAGNALAAMKGFHAESVFRGANNWWGDPSGPQHPSNPSGLGDPVHPDVTDFRPFLTAPPDLNDHPPMVRFSQMAPILLDGSKHILQWSAVDDGTIVAQWLEYTPHAGNPGFSVWLGDIPASTRSVEIVVPDFVASSNIKPSVFRIIAIDENGQQGWADYRFGHHLTRPQTLTFGPKDEGFSGEAFEITWNPPVSGSVYLDLADGTTISLGYGGSGSLPETANKIPAVSTDWARYRVLDAVAEEPFRIRPRISTLDSPPELRLRAPQSGDRYRGGGLVLVEWLASDDLGLRSFTVLASYDGGLSWNQVAADLPPSARRFEWTLPASTGIQEVLVRVDAYDTSFQHASSVLNPGFEILPGSAPELRLTHVGSCPGAGTLHLEGANPGGQVYFLYSFAPGVMEIPGGRPCAGLFLGLDPSSVQLAATAVADAAGAVALPVSIPAGACGRLFGQAVEAGSCRFSNLLAL